MEAVFSTGAVSLETEFVASWDRGKRWGMVDIAVASDSGDSGGPLFTPDGRVVAVFAWSRFPSRPAEGAEEKTAAGLRIDALCELLDYHAVF